MSGQGNTPLQDRLLKLQKKLKESQKSSSSSSSLGDSPISTSAMKKIKEKITSVNSKAATGIKRHLYTPKKERAKAKAGGNVREESKLEIKEVQKKETRKRKGYTLEEPSSPKLRKSPFEKSTAVTKQDPAIATPKNINIQKAAASSKSKDDLTESAKKNLFKRPCSSKLPTLLDKIRTLDDSLEVNKEACETSKVGRYSLPDFSEKQKGIIKNMHFKNNEKKSDDPTEKKLNSTPSQVSNTSSEFDSNNMNFSMEWEPNNETILRENRLEIHESQELNMEWQETLFNSDNNTCGLTDNNSIFFVIDTNVIIRNLSLIEDLLLIPHIKGFSVVVMVPWQVLKELDKLKTNENKTIAMCARKASKFLSSSFEKGYKLTFQKQSLHFKQCPDIFVEVPDDNIIKCCIQLKGSGKNVVLLTNDVNLRVKCFAMSNIPAEPDAWLSKLIEKDCINTSVNLHPFEIPPQGSLSTSVNNCPYFLHKLTLVLYNFLLNIIHRLFKKKYNELSSLWFAKDQKSSLSDIFSMVTSNTTCDTYKGEIMNIWSFYKLKIAYDEVRAVEIDDLGRRCYLLSKSMHVLDPELTLEFDKALGFLKTGNLDEQNFGYKTAASLIAQSFFKMMEEKLKAYLEYLDCLINKIKSHKTVVPDSRTVLEEIDKHIIITNETSIVFLLLFENTDVPLKSKEVDICYKVLLNFLGIKQKQDNLPYFVSEDIVFYINSERSSLNPSALEWLSDVRRKLGESKITTGMG